MSNSIPQSVHDGVMGSGSLDDIVRLYKISRDAVAHGSDLVPSNARCAIAQEIFVAIVRNISSVILLSNVFYSPKEAFYLSDAASLASLVRKLVESYETLHYLCVENISNDEFEFREHIYSLHHCSELESVAGSLSFRVDETWNMVRNWARYELSQNQVFRGLSPNAQTMLMEGKFAFFRNGKSASARRMERNERLKGIYKLFSNTIHSTSLGVNISRRMKIGGLLSFDGVMDLGVKVASHYGARSLIGYLKRRNFLSRSVSAQDRQFVRQLAKLLI